MRATPIGAFGHDGLGLAVTASLVGILALTLTVVAGPALDEYLWDIPDAATVRASTEPATLPGEPDAASLAARPLIARPVVVLYGDSLAWEARDHFAAAFAGRPDVRVVTRTFGGTAICDWLEVMRHDVADLAPGAVILELSGNASTACMHDAGGRPLTGAALVDRYQADAESAMDVFAPTGARVYLVSAPAPRSSDEHGAYQGGRLDSLYRSLAASSPEHAEFVDAGAAVLDGGRWTPTLPCLPAEPCDGAPDEPGRPVNVVRAPDGIHFCPVGQDADRGVTADCPVWSSGAFRFGSAMAGPVLAALTA